jgi:RNase P subunit RPR2
MKDMKDVKVAIEKDRAGTDYIVITCPICSKTIRLPFLETMEKYKNTRIKIVCSCGKASFVL